MTAAKSPRLAPRTGGRVLADALVAQGIDHVFAVPGVRRDNQRENARQSR